MKFRIDLKIIFFIIIFFFTGQLKIYLIILFFALLHELAHMIVGNILKFKAIRFEVNPVGFCIEMIPNSGQYNKEFFKSNINDFYYIFVGLAGPLLNLIIAIVFIKWKFVSEQMLRYTDGIFYLREIIIYSNLLVGIFNLMPIYPLDGGRILNSILRLAFGVEMGDRLINLISNAFMILLTVACSILILYLKNISILIILAYLWILTIKENKKQQRIE